MNAVLERPEITRFTTPDLDRHGKWMWPRLQQAFPHLNERALLGFLRGITNNNEYLFICSPNAVALAQVMFAHTLQPKPVVWERFVWVRDPQDKEMLAEGACMYDRLKDWAKSMHCETIIVEELSDIPHEMVRTHFGRIFNRQQQFAKV